MTHSSDLVIFINKTAISLSICLFLCAISLSPSPSLPPHPSLFLSIESELKQEVEYNVLYYPPQIKLPWCRLILNVPTVPYKHVHVYIDRYIYKYVHIRVYKIQTCDVESFTELQIALSEQNNGRAPIIKNLIIHQ